VPEVITSTTQPRTQQKFGFQTFDRGHFCLTLRLSARRTQHWAHNSQQITYLRAFLNISNTSAYEIPEKNNANRPFEPLWKRRDPATNGRVMS
jgi:hypothetical protein